MKNKTKENTLFALVNKSGKVECSFYGYNNSENQALAIELAYEFGLKIKVTQG